MLGTAYEKVRFADAKPLKHLVEANVNCYLILSSIVV